MKRPEILLVNPWIHDFAAYDLWARPLGLLTLATRLREAGWEPRFVDCLDTEHPEMRPVKVRSHFHGRFAKTTIPKSPQLENIRRTYSRYGVDPNIIRRDLASIPTPRAILVTSLMTYWYPGVRETIQLLREVFPGVPLLLGGVYASLLPDHAREYCPADDILVGPGERVLFQALHRQTGIESTPNQVTTSLEFRPALDLTPHVRFLPLITSRGCPYRCAYCASRKLFDGFVQRNPEEVVHEIKSVVLKYGIADIALYDDAFLVNAREHALPILEAVAERIPGLQWHTPNGLHAAAITEEVARAMKKAGFETIRIGLESSSDDFHERTGAKTNLEAFYNAVENLRDAGFEPRQIGVYLLVGIPGQTVEQIEEDVDRVLAAGALPKLAEYSPIPGTRMWPEALEGARYPIDSEPLFQNCTLLPAAGPGVDAAFLRTLRRRISSDFQSSRG
jgi:radical SAM superfamily enzyme YgiQ (UPF0313 family)